MCTCVCTREVWQESTTLNWVLIHDAAWQAEKTNRLETGNKMKFLHRCIIMHYAPRVNAVLRWGEFDGIWPWLDSFNTRLLPSGCSNNSRAHPKNFLFDRSSLYNIFPVLWIKCQSVLEGCGNLQPKKMQISSDNPMEKLGLLQWTKLTSPLAACTIRYTLRQMSCACLWLRAIHQL